MKLEPIDKAQMDKQITTIEHNNNKFIIIDILSTELLINDKFPKRILAAILIDTEKTWFFKMSGNEHTVGNAKETFLDFLKTITYDQ